MSHPRIALALAALSTAAAVPAVAAATSFSARPASAGAKLAIRHTSLGTLLVNGHGFTLYAFGRDSRNRDRCAHIAGCRGVWPLETTHARPTAGAGVMRSLLGTIRVGSSTQVTYAGHPLYTYSGDSGPGETSYVGVSQFGGKWSAVRPSGRPVG